MSTRPRSGELRSDFVRNATVTAGRADTYFELNKRQAGLNRLRESAGANPDPAVKADFDDLQRRLDADRARLDEITRKVIDPATVDVLREGLPPVDTIAGLVNVASGQGELRDYLAVIPLSVSKLGKVTGKVVGTSRVAKEVVEPAIRVIQRGGSHSKVKGLPGYHAHHIPADKISPITKGRGPTIAMLEKDHMKTLSYGSGVENVAHRRAQKELIDKGDFRGAQQLDIDDIRAKFGNKYDDAIADMLKYSREQGF